nr:MAG TPA: Portal protein [Caudoviricetes sp.]
MTVKPTTAPKEIKDEYKKGTDFKASIGDKGIFDQTKRNERFYIGDQWHGAKAGNERPLVRRNIIKRIGEYKMSVVTAAPITVNYSADGIPNTADMQDDIAAVKQDMLGGDIPSGKPEAPEISAITAAMSDYFRVTAERLKFDNKKEQVLRNAYISGTGILFTYWNDSIETGLYADNSRTKAIKGDIACEVLDVENVVFGDPNNDDIQSQPYIIIAQRRDYEEVRREARKNGLSDADIKSDKAEEDGYNSGDMGDNEPEESRRVTVYTKIYKEWDKDDKSFHVMAVRATEKTYVRKPWNLKLKCYPIAKFCWERRRSSAYGESEITYLIPNQIAINRALTAAVWGLMANGMPIMLVNGDVVTEPVTNDPGQIIKVYGESADVANAVKYIQPPTAIPQYQNVVNDLCSNTLSDSGANDAALGNLRPDNAAAIIQMREAATAPMQVYMNRFYDFIEDIARIWADFWLNLYGDRQLRLEDRNGTQYIPFKAERYRSLLITARVDVGAATMYSEAVVVETLNNLLSAGLISFDQFLERIPSGLIPDVTGLREDIKATQQAQASGGDITDEELLATLQQQYPEQYNALMNMPEQQRTATLAQIRGQAGGQGGEFETQEVGNI